MASKTASSSSTGASSSKLTLNDPIVSSFRPSKVFSTPDYLALPEPPSTSPHHFTSLDFDDAGHHLVTSGTDESIHLYDARTGRHQKQLHSKKYGVDLVRFTHRSSTVLYASTKGDDTIRYHSLHDNRYINYFRGHTKRVMTLQMNPVDDSFLSGAVDESVKLWDLRSPNVQGTTPIHGHPTLCYDPSGQVFALCISERRSILLYDARNFSNAPFLTIELEDDAYLSRFSMPPRFPCITALSFSPSSSSGHLLVATAGNQHYVVDSYQNDYAWRLVGHTGLEGVQRRSEGAEGDEQQASRGPGLAEAGASGQECTWSPDGKYVLAGSADGSVVVWEIPDKEKQPPEVPPQHHEAVPSSPPKIGTLLPVAKLEGHAGPVRALAFSPRTALFVSAGEALAFWLPASTGAGEEQAGAGASTSAVTPMSIP